MAISLHRRVTVGGTDDSRPTSDARSTCRTPAGHRAQPVVQRRPGSDTHRSSHLDHLQLCRVVDCHGALHSHVFVGRRSDRRGHELVASTVDHRTGQSDRADSDPPECTSGNQVRHSIPGACAEQLWNRWCKRPRAPACGGGMRLVRHSDIHRRRGGAHLFSGGLARVRSSWRRRHDPGFGNPIRNHIHDLLVDQHHDCLGRYERGARL